MPKRDDGLLWLIFAGAAIAAFTQRKSIAKGATLVYDEARYLIFKAIAGANAQPYTATIWKIAQDEGVNPFAILAIGDRESQWGAALRPDGTGDFGPRCYSQSTIDRIGASLLSVGESCGTNKFKVSPSDGGGWGRGIMQLDFASSPVAQRGNWKDPETNIRAGARLLKAKMAYLRGKVPSLSDGDLLRYGIIAYNRGEGGTAKDLLATPPRDPDAGTTQNYGSDVWSKIVALTNAFTNAGGTVT